MNVCVKSMECDACLCVWERKSEKVARFVRVLVRNVLFSGWEDKRLQHFFSLQPLKAHKRQASLNSSLTHTHTLTHAHRALARCVCESRCQIYRVNTLTQFSLAQVSSMRSLPRLNKYYKCLCVWERVRISKNMCFIVRSSLLDWASGIWNDMVE